MPASDRDDPVYFETKDEYLLKGIFEIIQWIIYGPHFEVFIPVKFFFNLDGLFIEGRIAAEIGGVADKPAFGWQGARQ